MNGIYVPKKLINVLISLVFGMHCVAGREAYAISGKCTGTPEDIAYCIVDFCKARPTLCTADNIKLIVIATPATWSAVASFLAGGITITPGLTAAIEAAGAATAWAMAPAAEVAAAVIAGGGTLAGVGIAVGIGGAVVIVGGSVWAIMRPDDFAQWLVPKPPDTCPALINAYVTMLRDPNLQLSPQICNDLGTFSRRCLNPPARLDHASCYRFGNAAAPANPQPSPPTIQQPAPPAIQQPSRPANQQPAPPATNSSLTCFQKCRACIPEDRYPNGCWSPANNGNDCGSGTCPNPLQPCAMGDMGKTRQQNCQ